MDKLAHLVDAVKERQTLINKRRELRIFAQHDNSVIPGLAELIDEIHQADIRLEQALAGLEV